MNPYYTDSNASTVKPYGASSTPMPHDHRVSGIAAIDTGVVLSNDSLLGIFETLRSLKVARNSVNLSNSIAPIPGLSV